MVVQCQEVQRLVSQQQQDRLVSRGLGGIGLLHVWCCWGMELTSSMLGMAATVPGFEMRLAQSARILRAHIFVIGWLLMLAVFAPAMQAGGVMHMLSLSSHTYACGQYEKCCECTTCMYVRADHA